MRLYLAGPIFTPREREHLAFLAKHLRKRGHDVFVPLELASPPLRPGSPRARGRTFGANVRELEQAEAVVAVLDGADADSGTAFEVGMAYARCTPVIGVRTDYRTLGNEGVVNLMLERGCTVLLRAPTDDRRHLVRDLERALAKPLLPPEGKLVRDKIPAIVNAQGRRAKARRARGEQLDRLMARKLIEEASELQRAATAKQRALELCDLWELLYAYTKRHGIGIEARRRQFRRRSRLGSYGKGVVLTALSARERARGR